MTRFSQEILENWQIRKTRRQKQAFRKRLTDKLAAEGYPVFEERHGLTGGTVNVVVGDVDQADVIFTAHYDTCAVLPFPNFITPRNLFFYVLYQLLIVLVLIMLSIGIQQLIFLLTKDAGASFFAYLTALLLFCLLILFGPPNRHTCNDNTSGVITLTEAILRIPPEEFAGRKTAFVFFDLEEAGMLGSCAFRRRHKKALRKKAVINFDCVSDGDHLLFAVNRRLAADLPLLEAFTEALPAGDEKETIFCSASSVFYPSDQMGFKKHAAVAAFRKSRILGLYMSRIHTPRDTVLDEKNIALLCGFILRLTQKCSTLKSDTEV